MAKNIVDMTDAEIEALSPEELMELQNGEAVEAGDEDGEEEDEPADDADAEEEDEAGEEEEEEPAADEPEIDEDKLQRLLADDDEDGEDKGDVPYPRFKELVDDNKDLKLMLRVALKRDGKQEAPAVEDEPEPEPEIPAYNFKAKMGEYHKLVVDGKDDEAGALLDEIEDKRAEVTAAQIAKASRDAQATALTVVTRKEIETGIRNAEAALYKQYPFLNNKGKTPDEDAILSVNAKARQLVAQGKAPDVALLEAGMSIGKKFAQLINPAAPAPKLDKDGKPVVEEAKKKVTGKLPDGSDPRSRDGLKRNLKLQQPDTLRAGKGNADKSVMKRDWKNMTDAEISKLPPEELEAAMMGATE